MSEPKLPFRPLWPNNGQEAMSKYADELFAYAVAFEQERDTLKRSLEDLQARHDGLGKYVEGQRVDIEGLMVVMETFKRELAEAKESAGFYGRMAAGAVTERNKLEDAAKRWYFPRCLCHEFRPRNPRPKAARKRSGGGK